MADPIHQLWSNVVFAFDMDSLTPNGLLRDFGPNGLHATFPGGANNPMKQLDGSYLFSGNQWLLLSGDAQARFYAKAPTGAHCWLLVASATGGSPFATYAAVNKGNILLFVGGRLRVYQGQTAALPYVWAGAVLNPMDGTRHSSAVTVETTPRGFLDGVVDGPTWVAGAFGVLTYDTTVVPSIGSYPGGGTALNGRMYYLALLSVVPTTPELLALNRMTREGGKPWVTRG